MPQMRILDASGDTVIEWDRDDATTVETARAVFCQLHAQRRLAFAIPRSAPRGSSRAAGATQIRSFDPDDDRDIVWVRPVQGG